MNKTELVIGEIQEVRVQESAINSDGYIDVDALELVAVSGLDSYHTANRLARLSYAKPDSGPRELE